MVCLTISWVFFFKQKTAYEMRISDWSSDVCSSDLSPRSRRGNDCVNMPMKLLPCFYRIMGPAPTDRFSGRIIGLSGVPAFARLSAPLRNCTSHRTVQSISIPWSAHGHGLARRPDLRLRRSDAAHLHGRRWDEHTSELK